MSLKETRIFKHASLSADYAFVSMPQTAWYWLDDLVKRQFPVDGYKALMRTIDDKAGCPQTLSLHLRRRAQEHCEAQMAELYNLANDNQPKAGYADLKANPAHPSSPDISTRMPSMYWLFRFLPHTTYLTTVWERRNYHLRPEKH